MTTALSTDFLCNFKTLEFASHVLLESFTSSCLRVCGPGFGVADRLELSGGLAFPRFSTAPVRALHAYERCFVVVLRAR